MLLHSKKLLLLERKTFDIIYSVFNIALSTHIKIPQRIIQTRF